ncbi:putative transmembrane sensor/regulatory protein [Pedobacter sp. BAL39]|uniref:FecR family protein n=1 Tax=Pedobacter sp. BAL39 TaxID=391596 RepID=UPI0001559729|nr:FecR family protein [Pedobacter sp. BAL39]EDM36708.1 putative transmembrane sensor/regulatory protein [Pedobacter sp. BAL39]
MNYNLYQAADFAADESFVAYFLKTDTRSVEMWSKWISLHPEKLDEVYNAEQLLSRIHFRPSEQDMQQAFDQFNAFLEQDMSPAHVEQEKPRSRFRWKTALVMACSIVLISVTLYSYLRSTPNLQYVTRHNDYGKISVIKLSDGTVINLNSNSSVRYPKVFKGTHREITLEGEAFFEVAKDKSRPFTVSSNGLKTTVLGTRFNVNAYKGNDQIRVALVEGSVSLQIEGTEKSILLKPSEMGSFHTSRQSLTTSDFDAEETMAWKEGIISFKHASFEEVARKMNNIYGIRLINKSNDHHWNYTGQFRKTDYLSIIQSMCFAKKINYTQNNQSITLTP